MLTIEEKNEKRIFIFMAALFGFFVIVRNIIFIGSGIASFIAR